MTQAAASVNHVNVHRAFVLSALMPGLGLSHAGLRMAGRSVLAVVIALLVAFALSMGAAWLNTITFMLTHAAPLRTGFWIATGVCALLLYALWVVTLATTIDLAMRRRAADGAAPQRHAGWGGLMSWLCPGAAQIYSGARTLGYLLCAANLGVLLLQVIAALDLGHAVLALFEQADPLAFEPIALAERAVALLSQSDISAGHLLGDLLATVAMALAMWSLRRAPSGATPSTRALVAAAIGFLCPGAPQLQQARPVAGLLVVAGYVALHLASAVLVARSNGTATDWLGWLALALQWGALLEAAIMAATKAGGGPWPATPS